MVSPSSDPSAGTPLAVPETVWLHHLGSWVEDHAAEKDRLGALGFDAIDAGGLDESWRQQLGTRVYTTDLDAAAARAALAAASTEQTVQWRARLTGSRP
jgi:hypothetical protein